MVSLGRMTFGPKASYNFKIEDGTMIAPYIGVKGIWGFEKAEIVDLDAGTPANGSEYLRARVEGGMSILFSNGWSLNGQGSFDGIGANKFSAYGGSMKLILPLN